MLPLLLLLGALVSGALAQESGAAGMSTAEVTWRIAVCCLLVAASAYCSGLTLAVMGLDPFTLEITSQAGTPKEREWALAILPVRRKGNQLLATLLW